MNRLMQFSPASRYQQPTDVLTDLRDVMHGLDAADWHDGNGSPVQSARPSGLRTVMCIENRTKQQNDLRSYFSRHGYRVLVLNDLRRGLIRLESDPPDCMVIMAESVGPGAEEGFREATMMRNGWPMVTVLVLPENEADRRDQFEQSPTNKVLVQPVTLRELRMQIDNGLNKTKAGSEHDEN